MTTIALLHPGEMGSAVGAALRGRGHDVLWCTAGRSAMTRGRADAADLTAVDDLGDLLAAADVVLSIVPPAAAIDVAADVAGHGFAGLYVDANAIAPRTALDVAEMVVGAGAAFVDGGLVGPPPLGPGRCRLYLSGPAAAEVAALVAGSPLEARVVDDRFGSASALKAAYAGYTKGRAALLLSCLSAADAYGVADVLEDEWARSLPDLPGEVSGLLERVHRKAWRFVGEMEQIALALDHAGQPATFHLAAAEVYSRLAHLRGRGEVTADAVRAALHGAPDGASSG